MSLTIQKRGDARDEMLDCLHRSGGERRDGLGADECIRHGGRDLLHWHLRTDNRWW